MNLELDPRTIYEALKQCFNLIQDVSWVLVLQESILYMARYLRYEGVNTQNTTQEGESGLQLMLRSPVLILIQSHFSKWMKFPSESGYLFEWPLTAPAERCRRLFDRPDEGERRWRKGGGEGRGRELLGGDNRLSLGIDSLCLQTISQPFTCNITCVSPINTPRYIMVGLA